jgi:hypothetical protein
MSDERPHIEIDKNTKLYADDSDYRMFENRMTIIYGRSGSGKSTLLFDILYKLRDRIPHVYVISPTNAANKAFDDYIASQCIMSGTDTEKTIAFLQNFVTRQRDLTSLYNDANNIVFLKKVFDRLYDTDEAAKIDFLERLKQEKIAHESRSNRNPSEKHKAEKQIEEYINEKIKIIYKSAIKRHKHVLDKLYAEGILSIEEKTVVRYLTLAPKGLIIFDDCASRFKGWIKQDKKNIIKQIFYEGRQYNISTIILTQSDKEFPPEFRDNAMCSLFTTGESIGIFFKRSSGGHTSEEKKKAESIAETVFNNHKYSKLHMKILYSKHIDDSFRYFVARVHGPFQMGAQFYWELDKQYRKLEQERKKTNPIYTKYL